MQIRQATLNDASALNLLEWNVFPGDRISPRQMRRFIQSSHACMLVAEEDGQLAGYSLVLFHRGTHLARLYSIATSQAFRGKAVGLALLQASERETVERGYITLRLEVRSDNEAAINLYQKNGYKVLKTLIHYYDDLADGIRMYKRLTPPGPQIMLNLPLYAQTTAFSCGPSCLLMSFACLTPEFVPSRQIELQLWREATTIYMTSGHGGCSAHGLALAALNRGYGVALYCQSDSVPFVDSVRDDNKKAVIRLVHEDFVEQLKAHGIESQACAPGTDELKAWLAEGWCVLMLVSTYRFNGEKGPHWIVLSGCNEQYFFFHDPNVEQRADAIAAAHVPISQSELASLVRYGRQRQVSYLVIKPKNGG
ncbi:GNAT family N-acetyltransferase/peptidase C39 family protein [Shewanella sedimentimangrovi]|uniref:GNAT family N-acetyltransferase/peptidase C39 family protein n=1 Tax=Shewanella sedimentimangrovi TaxID=2814293 RepID=A0ABX7R564_9GAMM|nr:GNAT family N-acetyltransferase/peptidase C39 family protein [Shewanella sedimentimangrovi]QSX38320.1 GNAT family N-acetyltransferase/peptidase C39 family protein [Shewanella sedimentimangrovi]